MKKISLGSIVLQLLISLSISAQVTDTVEVSDAKTVVLAFDAMIKSQSTDFGSSLYAGKVYDNKIFVKCVMSAPKESSLYIETDNGGVYSFILKKSANPKKLTYSYDTRKSLFPVIQEQDIVQMIKGNTTSNEEMGLDDKDKMFINDCERVIRYGNHMHQVGVKGPRVLFSLGNMMVKDKYMYFKVDIANTSYINYDINFFKFVIRNRKGHIRKMAVQEEEKTPVYIYNNNTKMISGKNTVTKVFVFEKFTMDQRESIYFELWETGGDRKVGFKLGSEQLLEMKRL